jgi:hypothetical protein
MLGGKDWRSDRGRAGAMLRAIVYGLAYLVTAGPALAADDQFDGVYIGTMELTNGSAPGCLASGAVSITISGNNMKLVDSRSHAFALRFDPALDGSFITSYQGLADGLVDVRGGVAGKVVNMDTTNYGDGCAHHVHAEKSGPKNPK